MKGIKNNVERVMKVIDLFAGCGGLNKDALSSKVALLHFSTKEFRKRSSDIQIEKEIIVNSIVDNNDCDYDELATKIDMANKKIDRGMKNGHLVVEKEYYDKLEDRYKLLSSDEIMAFDDEEYGDRTFNTNKAINSSHKILLENSEFLYKRVKDELTSMRNMLIELKEYEDKLEENLYSTYENICNRYKLEMWPKQKDKLKFAISATLNGVKENEDKIKAIEHHITKNKLSYNSTEKEFVESNNPALYLFKHRKEISEEGMYSLIQARYVEETLESIKTYFMLKGESIYPHLFKDLASEKFVTIMLPSLLDYDKYETKYKRLGILLACHDLGLTIWNSEKSISPFHEIVNNALNHEEDKTPNARTYQTYYSKLSEKRFHKLLKKEGSTGEEKKTIDNLKDGYHFALSTLCLAMDRKYPPLELDLPLEMKKLHAAAIHPKDLHDKLGNHIAPKTLYRYRMVVNGDVKEFLYFNNDI